MSRQASREPWVPPIEVSSSSRLVSVGPSRHSAPAYVLYGTTCAKCNTPLTHVFAAALCRFARKSYSIHYQHLNQHLRQQCGRLCVG